MLYIGQPGELGYHNNNNNNNEGCYGMYVYELCYWIARLARAPLEIW